jgi:hypothetical protein
MYQQNQHIDGLILLHLREELDESGKRELDEWINASDENKQLFERLTDPAFLASNLKAADYINSAAMLKEIRSRSNKVFFIGAENWRKYVAAAAILFFIAGVYFWNRSNKNEVAITKDIAQQKADVAPGHDGAVLKLSNGNTIVLDSAANGTLANQGTTQVVKKANGQLVYNSQTGEAQIETIYNELSTARGRKFQVTLPDGSNVWLNASSSIRYPVQFTANERRVEITGEAYFEVTHNIEKPFIVHVSVPGGKAGWGADVRVLGTHFNVMAYQEEDAINTTLLQGSVKVISNKATALLAPGQQAQIVAVKMQQGQQEIKIKKNADVDKAVAWKNGYFSFKNDNIETLMKQIERWYDVDVIYEDKIPQTFSGTIPSNVNVSNIFKILETTGSVHFRIEGKKIIITK